MSEGSPPPVGTPPLSRIPFTAQAEASIRALSSWMRIAAIFGIIGAICNFISAFTPRHNFGNLIGAIVALLVGVWTFQAATAFAKVANTDTADQRYLMEGFTHLRSVFLLHSVLIIIYFAILALALIFGIVVLMTHGIR